MFFAHATSPLFTASYLRHHEMEPTTEDRTLRKSAQVRRNVAHSTSSIIHAAIARSSPADGRKMIPGQTKCKVSEVSGATPQRVHFLGGFKIRLRGFLRQSSKNRSSWSRRAATRAKARTIFKICSRDGGLIHRTTRVETFFFFNVTPMLSQSCDEQWEANAARYQISLKIDFSLFKSVG